MHVLPRPRSQPCLDLGMLVGNVVVDDAVHDETFGHRLVNLAQERQKLLVPVTRLAGGQYRSGEHIQGRNSVVVP